MIVGTQVLHQKARDTLKWPCAQKHRETFRVPPAGCLSTDLPSGAGQGSVLAKGKPKVKDRFSHSAALSYAAFVVVLIGVARNYLNPRRSCMQGQRLRVESRRSLSLFSSPMSYDGLQADGDKFKIATKSAPSAKELILVQVVEQEARET